MKSTHNRDGQSMNWLLVCRSQRFGLLWTGFCDRMRPETKEKFVFPILNKRCPDCLLFRPA